MSSPPLLVAIDGPSGVGKSTAAKGLAACLGIPYLDTGAMYRCVALEALQGGVDLASGEALQSLVSEIDLDLEFRPPAEVTLLLHGRAVGEEIRTPEVSLATSKISSQPAVRRKLVELQRQLGNKVGGVVEGRDIGTVVFPQTPHKFFLDADLSERARRRQDQLREEPGSTPAIEEVRTDLATRDQQDREREDSPLLCDDSYFRVDTTHLTPDQVLEAMVSRIEKVSATP